MLYDQNRKLGERLVVTEEFILFYSILSLRKWWGMFLERKEGQVEIVQTMTINGFTKGECMEKEKK